MATTARFIPWSGQTPQQQPLGQQQPIRLDQPMYLGGSSDFDEMTGLYRSTGTANPPMATTQGLPSTAARFQPYRPQGIGAPTGGQISMGQIGNPSTASQIGGAVGNAGKTIGAINTANQYGGNFLGDLAPYMSQLGSLLGVAGAGFGINNAVQTGNVAGGLASGIGGAQSAASLAGMAPAGLGMLLGPVTLGLAIAAYNHQAQQANKVQAAMKETSQIRKDASTAVPQLLKSPETFQQLLAAQTMPQDQLIQELQRITGMGMNQQAQIPAVSQFTSTQGGRHSTLPLGAKVAPLDVTGIEKLTPDAYMYSMLNELAGRDQLARLGAYDKVQGPGYGETPYASPERMLNLLSQSAGLGFGGSANLNALFNPYPGLKAGTQDELGNWIPGETAPYIAPEDMLNIPGFTQTASQGQTRTGYYGLTDAQRKGLQSGGSILPTLQSIFSTLNPQFATTKLGGLLAQLGVSPQSIGQVSPQSQATVEQGLTRAADVAAAAKAQQEQEALAQWMASTGATGGGGG